MDALTWSQTAMLLFRIAGVAAVCFVFFWLIVQTFEARTLPRLRRQIAAQKELEHALRDHIVALEHLVALQKGHIAQLTESDNFAWSLLEQLGRDVPGAAAYLREHENVRADVERFVRGLSKKGGK